MGQIVRFCLECQEGYLHQGEEGATLQLFALRDLEGQRVRVEEEVRQLDALKRYCGPHRAGGPYPA